MQHALTRAFLVVVLTLIGVFLIFGQHRLDQPRQFVRGRGDGFGLIHTRLGEGEYPVEIILHGA